MLNRPLSVGIMSATTIRFTLSGNYVRVAQTIHVDGAIDRYRGPVLVVQGEDDDPALVAAAVAAAKRYQHAQLEMIPDDTHCYDRHLDQMTGAVRGFMLRQLAAR